MKKEDSKSSYGGNTNSTARNVLVQGTILAAASIIAKVIGLIYRIPLTNILGDEGNTYYSTANEIYSIILMISSFSLPLAVSRLMSERLQKGETRNASRVFWIDVGITSPPSFTGATTLGCKMRLNSL